MMFPYLQGEEESFVINCDDAQYRESQKSSGRLISRTSVNT